MNRTMSRPALTAVTSHFPKSRKHLRFSCVAEADVTTLDGRRHLTADVSELSRCGCYLDTPDAFDAGTKILLRIRHNGYRCELPGRVIYVHKGWGMGVVFEGATTPQLAALEAWLIELCERDLIGVGP